MRSRILKVEFLTPNFYRLILEKPAGFSYHPGQFISVHLDSDRRFYSLASHPMEGKLELGIKRKEGGKFSDRLHRMEGQEIEISGPFGVMHKNLNHDRIAFLAIGSGITPLVSVFKSLNSGSHLLVYGEKSEEYVPYKDFLDSLENVKVIYAFSHEGRHVQDFFSEVRKFKPDFIIGVGNVAFANDVRNEFPEFRKHVEGFG